MPAFEPQSRSSFRTSLRSVALGLSVSMAATSTPAWASSSARAQEEAAAQDTAPTTGGRVAILRFTGDKDFAAELRSLVATDLEALGFTVGGIRVSMEDAAKRNKCDPKELECLTKVAAYVNKNAKQPFNFYVFADAADAGPMAGQTRLMMFDIDKGAVVTDIAATRTPNDSILLNAMVISMRQSAARYQSPLPELSAEERAKLDNPGDPEKTAEEAAEEKRILAESEKKAATQAKQAAVAAVDDVDLKRDFKEFCRTGPRNDTEVRDIEGNVSTERDFSPVCKRGAFFGYWQPRSFALAAVSGLGLLTALGLYGMSLAERGKYNKARDKFKNAFGSETSAKALVEKQNDLFKGRACDAANQADCYVNLAGEVSDSAYRVRRMAVYGDIALGVSVVLAGITALSVYQDRNDAKKYLREKRALKLSDLRVAPVFGGGFSGAAASLRF